ncbi:MAG: ASKHA domain-containing protein [Candidatus Odinarchaeia archaeon]
MIKTKIVIPEKKEITVYCQEKGEDLLSLLQKNKIPINAICTCQGKCGKCKIEVISNKNNLNEITENERIFLSEEEIKKNIRLACQVKILGPATIRILKTSLPPDINTSQLGYEPPVKLNPPIRKEYLEIKIEDYRNLKTIKNKIRKKLYEKNLKSISFHQRIKDLLLPIFNFSNGKITVTLRDNKIINVEHGNTVDKNYGFALDLGTTQISLFLIDMNTGKNIDFISESNNQISFGADVISRLTFIMKKKENMKIIHSTIITQINSMLEKITEKNGIRLKDIYEGVIVGNTVMMHIFHNTDPTSLSKYPYQPKITKSQYILATAKNIKINRLGKIYTPPNVAGYMGSDIIADIIASQAYNVKENTLLLDIGTNTEIVLIINGKFYGASTPSGPAFEGGEIEFGMLADKGAIDSISINPENYELNYSTIGGRAAIGLCGSGIIDLVSELYKRGVIDDTGKIIEGKKLVTNYKKSKAILIKKDTTRKIVFTQKDIREVQKAKAAIQAGYLSLLEYTKGKIEEIKNVIIAGSFGVHINLESGQALGIIPPVETDKIQYLGNLAGSGARLMLKSINLRKEANKLSEEINYIELGNLKNFQDLWIKALHISN